MERVNLTHIVVLRGGKHHHADSVTAGAQLMRQFTSCGAETTDVYIDQQGVWFRGGIPIDPTIVFAHADAYVDFANQKEETPYHSIAKRLGVKRLLAPAAHEKNLFSTRENIYRILRQQRISVPDTHIFRKGMEVKKERLHSMWRTMMIPLVARSVYQNNEGKVMHTLPEVLAFLEDKTKNQDIMVSSYRNAKSRTVVLLPQYRGEDLYAPLPIETQTAQYALPRNEHRILPLTYLSPEEKTNLITAAKDVYRSLDSEGILVVDLIQTSKGYMVTEVTASPSLFASGRFQQSLLTTGIDLAHYLLQSIKK